MAGAAAAWRAGFIWWSSLERRALILPEPVALVILVEPEVVGPGETLSPNTS
jgi:hypothetical protein